MSWKDWSYSGKGMVIGVIVGLLYGIAYRFGFVYMPFSRIAFYFVGFFTSYLGSGFNQYFQLFLLSLSSILFSMILFSLFGIVIGFIFGKIKSKKQEEAQQ